jgi:hypothetical protein
MFKNPNFLSHRKRHVPITNAKFLPLLSKQQMFAMRTNGAQERTVWTVCIISNVKADSTQHAAIWRPNYSVQEKSASVMMYENKWQACGHFTQLCTTCIKRSFDIRSRHFGRSCPETRWYRALPCREAASRQHNSPTDWAGTTAHRQT